MMPLNKQNGNMYSWVTHTWNPLGGACPHECTYCSTGALIARNDVLRTKYTGEPRLIEKEIETELGRMLKTIFVCNMTDLFAVGVSSEIISAVLDRCRCYPYKTYLFQSKNPARFLEFSAEDYPKKVIFCTTIETNVLHQGISKAPIPRDRADAMIKVKRKFPVAKISVTIEPVIDFWEYQFLDMIEEIGPDFVSIGADSKGTGLPEPSPEKMQRLINGLQKFTRIERKSNLVRIMNFV